VQQNRLDFVSFVGYVRGPQKQRALADADAYVFPSSHGEGMPLSVLEAMAAGLPVICTRVAGLGDFFEDGRMGYSTESASVASFVDKITQLILHSEKLAEISLYNRQFAHSRFRATVVAGRLRSIYDMLTGIGTHANAPKDWLESDCRVIDDPGVH
jgi:glycosyltransferase involved in cell wall biosynthesis